MRATLQLLGLTAALALVVATAGCASEPEIGSVLFVDGCAPGASADTIDLKSAARAQSCDTAGLPFDGILVTVDDVVSARELVVTGRYGRERIRPWLDTGTIARLEGLGARDAELREGLQRELTGTRLVEPTMFFVPPVTADGLRLVALFTVDMEPVDSLVNSMLNRWPGTDVGATSVRAELAEVCRDDASLQEHVQRAVSEAERWSAFRAPPGLVVEWADTGDMSDAAASAAAEVRENDSCIDASDLQPSDSSYDRPGEFLWGCSLPGGKVLVQEDRDWREVDLQWVVMHELMHQHQYALCAAGLELRNVPPIIWQAHASSLAIEILEHEGVGKDELALIWDIDQLNGPTRAFDELRARLGLGADDCLRYLSGNPELARTFARQLNGTIFPFPDDGRPHGLEGLSFECSSTDGPAVVTIINETDAPFSGASDGWWYAQGADPDGRRHGTGGAPFALALPPRGRVTVRTQLKLEYAQPDSCFTVFRRTPSPVFEPQSSTVAKQPVAESDGDEPLRTASIAAAEELRE